MPPTGLSAPLAPLPPPPAAAALVERYCASAGDLAAAAVDAGVPIDDARAMVAAPWWQSACAAYWREHAPTAAQAQIAIRDVLARAQAGDASIRPADVISAGRVALDYHVADRRASALESLVSLARGASADRLLAEVWRRNLLRVPPTEQSVALAHAERMLAAADSPACDGRGEYSDDDDDSARVLDTSAVRSAPALPPSYDDLLAPGDDG